MTWFWEWMLSNQHFTDRRFENASDDRRVRGAALVQLAERFVRLCFGERGEQTAGGLRIAEYELRFLIDVFRVFDEIGQEAMIRMGAAGGDSCADVFPGLRQDGSALKINLRADFAGNDHVAEMPEQSEAGDVG